MDLITALLFLVGIADVVIGVYIGIQKPVTTIRKSYTWVVFGTAGWVLANAVFRLMSTDAAVEIAERLTFLFGTVATSAFLYFSFVFPYTKRPLKQWMFLYVVLSAVVICIFALFTEFFLVRSVSVGSHESISTYGQFYAVFFIWFIGTWIWSIANLLLKYKDADAFSRWQIRMMLFAVPLTIILAILFDLIAPYLQIAGTGWFASVSSVIWLGFTVYIVMKR
ncbi:MAG: histidine kinase N-terminal 7TM domain-containing protein [Patescibacteria group bacterium]|jgi:hypothetical protein